MAKKIETLRHKDKRANIPTQELRGFMEEAEKSPTILRYPRDSSLDPQLVWRGKDEQDGEDLAVPAVPIYIQEKIHPKAIIDTLRAEAAKGTEPMADLFADFNNIAFQDLIEFYEHEQNWSNRLILGDSLLVMASLAEKEGLRGKVQMIYMDPPYGIKFGSNWQVSTRKRDVKDGKVEDATREPEVIKAFRDTWVLGIHSYLEYLRDRLVTARDLLHQTGGVFVQIGDENVHFVRSILDEIFGAQNFVAEICFVKTSGFETRTLPKTFDFILWYAKDVEQLKYRQLYSAKDVSVGGGRYRWLMLDNGRYRGISAAETRGDEKIPENARLYQPTSLISQGESSADQTFRFRGRAYPPGRNQHWKTKIDGLRRLGVAGRIHVAENSLRYVRYAEDFEIQPIHSVWTDTATGNFTEDKIYVVQTASKVIERCLLISTDPGDLVLDPTCGSGTTAYVAEEWGRRWITIDTSRVALSLARARIMAARFPYYLLADSSEGLQKEAEVSGCIAPGYKTGQDIRKGFVCRRVPHVTLKSIASNAEIDTIHEKWQPKLDATKNGRFRTNRRKTGPRARGRSWLNGGSRGATGCGRLTPRS